MNQDNDVATVSTVAVQALVLLASVGCSSTPADGGGGPMPFIQIQSALGDGTTNAGQGPFPVSFHGAGRVLDADTLAGLLARLQMSTWPEGAPLVVTTTIDPTSPTSGTTNATAQVSSGTALVNRWYSLGFGPPEAGLTTQQNLDNGVWGVRLRPDSHPAVRVAQFCGVIDTGMKFIVTFSEPVTVDRPSEALTVQQGGATVSCRLDSVGPGDVHQFCAALVPGPATVSLAAGTVRGPDGVFLASQLWTVDIAELPIVETGCNGYRVPL
jgi:hypothetical protein